MIKFGKPRPDKSPPKVAAEPKPSKAKFDRNAYQREYMRKRRAALKQAGV
jgi:hypothetical protein